MEKYETFPLLLQVIIRKQRVLSSDDFMFLFLGLSDQSILTSCAHFLLAYLINVFEVYGLIKGIAVEQIQVLWTHPKRLSRWC